MTPEKVEDEYQNIVENVIYQLIKDRICKEHGLKVEDEELEDQARKMVMAQFAHYGMSSVPDELLAKYSSEMLKKEESIQQLLESAMEEKFVKWVCIQVKVETKEITQEEFNLKIKK
jgi:trigger factor